MLVRAVAFAAAGLDCALAAFALLCGTWLLARDLGPPRGGDGTDPFLGPSLIVVGALFAAAGISVVRMRADAGKRTGCSVRSEGEGVTAVASKTAKTTKTDKIVTAEDEAWRRWAEDADEEQRAFSRHPEFRAMLRGTSEAMKRDGGMTLAELHEALALTPEDEAEGERLLAELERQTEEEEATRLAARRRNGRAAPDTAAVHDRSPGGAHDPSLATQGRSRKGR